MVKFIRNTLIVLFVIGIIIAIPDSNSDGVTNIFNLVMGSWLVKLLFVPMVIFIIADGIISAINKNTEAKQNYTQYNQNIPYNNTNKRYEGYFDNNGIFHYTNGYYDDNGIWHDYDNVR